MFRISLLALGILSLSACASIGNLAAVNKKETLGSGLNGKGFAPAGVFIDAEQRAVLSNRRIEKDKDIRVVCAEPAPDALSAIAAQAGVSVSDISNAVSAEGGVSEAAANIGLRTQTIQTLRDGFYRVCEAYMNGLSEEQYSIMLRRFQTNMIALLAIEQLTGAVKGGDAVVSASAGSGMDFREQYLQRSAIASAEQARLTEDIAAVDDEIRLLRDVNDQCIGAPDASGCSGNEVERRGQKITELRAQRRALSSSRAAAAATQATNSELANSAPSASEASAGGVTGSWPASPAYPPSLAVAEAVRDITMALVQNDYGVQLCFEHLRYVKVEGETALSDRCRRVMDTYITRLENANAARFETQIARAAIARAVAEGTMSMDEADYLLTSGIDGTAFGSGPAPTMRSASVPFDEPPLAAAIVPEPPMDEPVPEEPEPY
ncbi:MAG: hypothetical protein AAFV37_04010 [Pseudomonadota bacterium]